MRSSFFVAASVAAALFTVFACSSEGGSGSSSGTLPDGAPEGSIILDDGAVIDPDGNIVNQDSRPPSKVNTTTEKVDVDGTPRTYLLSVPKTYDASKKYPLVMALHGDGQNGASFQSMLAFEDVSGDDAIVAYTDGSEDIYTPYDQNKDQKLVEVAIGAIKAKYAIDDAKVWAIGYSKGAFQLNQIACRKPGVFKAMAVHAGGAPEDRMPPPNTDTVNCPNAIALPVFVTEGSGDPGIGGQFAAIVWSQKAGCSGSTSTSTPPICKAYDGCPPATPVSICIVPGQGHYPLYDDAAEHSWAWFKSLP